ncbi:MAG: DUF2155 domain-containing protein [Alphaproteobacteria bacterium]|nr:MAG: DUF2155 domain-containing protein [Alphaproteobacteria bacterium]
MLKLNIKIIKNIIITITFCFIFILEGQANGNKKALIKIIDKISSKNYSIEINKNNKVIFKNIDISLIKCLKNDEDNNSFASYINLKDRKKNKFIFKGWIFSKNISLSQVAHPIYNIKLVKCI